MADRLIEVSNDGIRWTRYVQTFSEYVRMYKEEAEERGYKYVRVKIINY